MSARLLTVLLLLAAALWATAPAAAWGNDGGGPAMPRQAEDEEGGGPEPEDPPPIPDFWTEEEPASGGSSSGGSSTSTQTSGSSTGSTQTSEPHQTSTSPGGTEPASGTPTTGPGAPASADASRQESGPNCDPPATLRQSLRALRRSLHGRDLLTLRPKPVLVRIPTCLPGTYELAVVLDGTSTVLWRARRTLSTKGRATLRLTMTPAGRRFVARALQGPSRTVRMRLRARLYPV